MVTSLIKGFWTALRNPKLVLLLWAWTVLLGLAAAMPARAWFGTALNTATESGSLLTQFNFGAYADVSKYNEMPPFGMLVAAVLGVGFIALIGSAFMNGGLVEVIGTPADSRTFMHRFFRGGGHFFWRFVRLALLAYIPGAIVTGFVSAGMGAITTPLSNSEWEPAGMVWGLVSLAVAGLVALWFVLALDYARIHVARDGSRSMIRTYLSSMKFISGRVFGAYGIAIVCLVAVGALLVAYVAHETAWTASTWGTIGMLVAVQQVIVLARAGVRVTQVASEWHYSAGLLPAPVTAPVFATPPVVAAVEPVPPPTEVTPAV